MPANQQLQFKQTWQHALLVLVADISTYHRSSLTPQCNRLYPAATCRSRLNSKPRTCKLAGCACREHCWVFARQRFHKALPIVDKAAGNVFPAALAVHAFIKVWLQQQRATQPGQCASSEQEHGRRGNNWPQVIIHMQAVVLCGALAVSLRPYTCILGCCLS
jgi:hypothetical protein